MTGCVLFVALVGASLFLIGIVVGVVGAAVVYRGDDPR